jgi:Predicted metal binding domain
MRVDPEVSRLKYECEMRRLVEQRAMLEERGIFVLGSGNYPFVDLFYAPRHPIRLFFPAASTDAKQLPANSMAAIDIPSLAGRGFKARFNLSDYDIVAPSLEFLDPWTNQLIPYETMFRALEFEKQRGAHIVVLPDHPITHKPFLCLRGVREYHDHPQHSGDDWFLYRDTVSLFSMVMSLWRVTLDISRPQIILQSIEGKLQIQVQWAAEAKA